MSTTTYETIKVDFTPPGSGGRARVQYCNSNGQPLTASPTVANGTSKVFTLELTQNNDWYFYAISFWGGGKNPSGGGTTQSVLSQAFLDGWYKGHASLALSGEQPFMYITDINVNRDSSNNPNTEISFTVNNTNASQAGRLALELTFTNSTDQSEQTLFYTGRDPEIELLKSPPG